MNVFARCQSRYALSEHIQHQGHLAHPVHNTGDYKCTKPLPTLGIKSYCWQWFTLKRIVVLIQHSLGDTGDQTLEFY